MGKKKTLAGKVGSNIVILVVFILVIIFCMGILRDNLWKNANEMGLALVKNYSAAEEKNINTCQVVLDICANYIAEREQGNLSRGVSRGLDPFIDGLTDTYGEENIQIYGRLSDGTELVSNIPEIEGMTDYDITGTDWYQGAAQAKGDVYTSSVYTDALTGDPIVTMCKIIPETGSFLAIDLKAPCFEVSGRDVALPNMASYYLVDREGRLIYYLSSWEYGREEFQALVDGYRENAVCGTVNHVSENVNASDGIVRNVFFHHMDNGWTGILTIPKDEILSGTAMFQNISFILIVFGILLIVFQTLREYKNGIRESEYLIYQNAMNSTVHACRAIYYIDVKKRICDTVYPLGADGKTRRSDYDREVEARFKYGIVAEEHKEQVADFLDMSNIISRLAERDHIELQFKRKRLDGDGFEWCSIAVTVAEMKNGELSAITMAIRSIDDVIQREEEQKEMLALAVARAEAASNAKSDFLSRMSHDIRAPMNAILGMTAVAAMHIDEKSRVMDALEKITVSGKHLLGLINEVLDMSRIESGKVSLTENCFNLSDTIESFLTVFQSQIEAKELALNVSIAKLEHENVIGDEQHLQQIFMNIMGNAVKFTPPGGSITIRIAEKQSHITGSGSYEFVFEDTGIGMEQEYIRTIFEPFSRAANSSGSKIEGTGLGMSIAVNIARMMDGDIKVESELGKGSKFTVTVHLKLNDITQEDMDSFATLPVLVVDDEQEACESACEILCSLGMNAEYVLDGDSAVKRVTEANEAGEDFSVVILDWKMPGKDGLETAREIRGRISEQIPIIILSAYDWSDIEAEALEAGVNAFISKPLFKSRLVRVLLNVLGQGGEEETPGELETFRQQDFSGRRVLLVEDNEINIEVAAELLNVVGIQVETALNGRLAVDQVLEKESGYYDLIFMDIQMPVMNGYEAARAIRSSGREDLRDIPIVAMTADAFSDDVRKSKDAGMNDHISKPVDIKKLEDALQRWIPQI
ncbi:MAG: response regulator [bacterium]|nr:response regulator [bacterium]MCM1374306.1 response regulator [Muribaculum sp.]